MKINDYLCSGKPGRVQHHELPPTYNKKTQAPTKALAQCVSRVCGFNLQSNSNRFAKGCHR